MPSVHRYETLRPEQLRAIVDETPVLYWPLGLLEHHGWHLPVGYDGIKSERLCLRLAGQAGGVVLPVMWWGGVGGHGLFAWTFYQAESAFEQILERTLDHAVQMGFRVIVAHAGHYPWQHALDRLVPKLTERYPHVLFLAGTELRLGEAVGVPVRGDHAARWETTYGLALLPEYVDLTALTPGRRDADWPTAERPDPNLYEGLELDPASPLFGQLGEDPRDTASSQAGEAVLSALCDALTARIRQHLAS